MSVDAGAGGATPPVAPPATPPTTPPATPPDLGPGGVAALTAERDARTKAENRVKELEAEQETARVAALSANEQAIIAARNEGRTEAETEFAKKELGWKVRQAATVGVKGEKDALLVFHDPADAELFAQGLKPESTDAEIAAALLKLATDKPHLVKGSTPPPTLQRGPSGGAPIIGEGGNPDATGDNFLRGLRDKTAGESLTL